MIGNVNIFMLNIPHSNCNTFITSTESFLKHLSFQCYFLKTDNCNGTGIQCLRRHFPSTHLFINVELDCYSESCSSFINDLGSRTCATFIYYIHSQFSSGCPLWYCCSLIFLWFCWELEICTWDVLCSTLHHTTDSSLSFTVSFPTSFHLYLSGSDSNQAFPPFFLLWTSLVKHSGFMWFCFVNAFLSACTANVLSDHTAPETGTEQQLLVPKSLEKDKTLHIKLNQESAAMLRTEKSEFKCPDTRKCCY